MALAGSLADMEMLPLRKEGEELKKESDGGVRDSRWCWVVMGLKV